MSYWEHFKYAEDISRYLPLDDPKRKILIDKANQLQAEMNTLQIEINNG